MTNHAQLIAAAEVLGVDACGDCDPCIGGRPDQCAVSPYPNWLASLDACFVDIVTAMRKHGFCLELYQRGDRSWVAKFDHEKRRSCFIGQDPTAPRGIVKAFLIYNNRWVDRPDNQRKGGND